MLKENKEVDVMIITYNNENFIKETIESVLNQNYSNIRKIIIADDGSKDGTRQILKTDLGSWMLDSGKNQIKIIYHEKNQGKGAAIRTGFENSTGDIIIIQDADLEYNPGEYATLIRPIIEKKYEIVYGSRLMKGQKNPIIYLRYYLGNKVMSFVSNILFGSRITDAYTCYKVFTRNALNSISLKSSGFEIEAELTAKFLKNGYKILELPITYNPRSLIEGKKINWKDAIKGIFTLIKIKFGIK